MPTAILIDGGFFLKRYYRIFGSQPPEIAARALHKMCLGHLDQSGKNEKSKHEAIHKLYRIFFYDCPPLSKKVHFPVSKTCLDFSTSPTAIWRTHFHAELRTMRKVALRLGYLNERGGHWEIRPDVLKQLLSKTITLDDLKDSDFNYDVRQKGVDMRIGLDIASMAFKRQVDQIILVAGDSDFVPAAKLARREGIDFILDPLWASIRPDLHEHIDGLRSVWGKPAPAEKT